MLYIDMNLRWNHTHNLIFYAAYTTKLFTNLTEWNRMNWNVMLRLRICSVKDEVKERDIQIQSIFSFNIISLLDFNHNIDNKLCTKKTWFIFCFCCCWWFHFVFGWCQLSRANWNHCIAFNINDYIRKLVPRRTFHWIQSHRSSNEVKIMKWIIALCQYWYYTERERELWIR